MGDAAGAVDVHARTRCTRRPPPITETFPDERWTFVGCDRATSAARQRRRCRRDEGTLDANGRARRSTLDDRRPTPACPTRYTLEGDVEDVSRQHIAEPRAACVVHPAPWYIGVKRLPYFADQKDGPEDRARRRRRSTAAPCAGVPVDVTLTQVQWNSVRRAEGNGFYTWDTEREGGRRRASGRSRPAPSPCR